MNLEDTTDHQDEKRDVVLHAAICVMGAEGGVLITFSEDGKMLTTSRMTQEMLLAFPRQLHRMIRATQDQNQGTFGKISDDDVDYCPEPIEGWRPVETSQKVAGAKTTQAGSMDSSIRSMLVMMVKTNINHAHMSIDEHGGVDAHVVMMPSVQTADFVARTKVFFETGK